MVEQSGAGFVVVYNPNGIVGLKTLAGQFVKQLIWYRLVIAENLVKICSDL